MLKAILLFVVTTVTASPTSLRLLFPAHRQYVFSVKTTVSTGLQSSETYWSLDGKLSVVVGNNFTRARFQLEDLEASAYSGENNFYNKSNEAEKYLLEPWEVDYSETGLIDAIHLGFEPVWAQNVKRALSLNFQVTKKTGTYKVNEPCLHHQCYVVYTTNGNKINKYTNQKVVWSGTEYYWSTIPAVRNYAGRGYPESMALSERLYEIDDVKGLINIELKGTFQYKTNDNVLSTFTFLSLYYESHRPIPELPELSLNKTTIQYVTSDCTNPSNSIRDYSQSYLKNKTYKILLKIATKGIDADNIVRNATFIHNLDFSILLSTMAQMDYEHLVLLFEDLILGTSYDIETAKNIFLEMIPHAKTNACARLIKYLVIEKKEKIEDAAIIALIRKLPFNVAKFNQTLLEELEVLTKLGLDFSPEVRRAGILSFATLVQKTQYTHNQPSCCSNYLDYIVVKYFRMYNDCPQYIDRLIWLQGLGNMNFASQGYTNVIFGDTTKNKYERLWAALSSRVEGFYETNFEVLKTNIPILTNQTEHIQLRIVAVHNILSSSSITESDFLFVHNVIKFSANNQLKSFWYSSILSLANNKAFGRYRVASSYVPFIIDEIPVPDSIYWATNNKIISDGDASLQMISVGDDTMVPGFAALKVSTGGLRPYQAGIYIVAQGVSADLYKGLIRFNADDMKMDELVTVLQKLAAWGRKVPDEVHVDVVVKVLDMTVYATHLNQTRKYFSDALFSALDFLRMGSHINQQLIHVPSQMEVHVPSVLGIPIRLHTTTMSFASIRGNLSASENLFINNDLHVRYQGIALTSLSTDGLLLQSEHVARVQSSVVAHLPMKFNISLKNAEDLFSSLYSKKGGIAMHSRKEIALITEDAQHVQTVGGENRRDGVAGYFSDCKLEGSFVDLMEKIGIKIKGDVSFLDPILKLIFFVKNMVLSSVPTHSSCGLVFPIQSNAVEKVVTMRLKVSHQYSEGLNVEFTPEIKYYTTGESEQSFLTSVSKVFLKVTKTHLNFSLLVENEGYDKYEHHYPKNLKLNFSHLVDYHPRIDQDITDLSLNYNGTTSVVYTSGQSDRHTKIFNVKYKFEVNNESEHEKALTVNVMRDGEMPELVKSIVKLLSSLIPEDTLDILMKIDRSNNVLGSLESIVIKEGVRYTAIKTDRVNTILLAPTTKTLQYLDSLTTVQRLKKIGLYKQCRVQQHIVQTLQGTVERVEPQYSQRVVLADCTSEPKFAVLRLASGGFRVHDGGYYVDLKDEQYTIGGDGSKSANQTQYFDIEKYGDVIRICLSSNLDVYYRRAEVVILVPSVYTDSLCGECSAESLYIW